MDRPEPKNPIRAVVAALLSGGKGGLPLIEEACDLLVADLRLNDWLASMKGTLGEGKLSEEDWISFLEDIERIYADCLKAGHEFQSYDWPRARFDEWAERNERLRVALREARLQLDDLGRPQGRRNQSWRVSGDA